MLVEDDVAVLGQLPAVEVLPPRGLGLEGGVAGRDPLAVDREHGVGVLRGHRRDMHRQLPQQQAGVQPVSAQQAAACCDWASGAAMVPAGPSVP
ncbi:MAG: hypothetical protein QOE59_3725 [Actinomycetota bacterium]|nr:hypothetical protein [Actinomycetota bacterium]